MTQELKNRLFIHELFQKEKYYTSQKESYSSHIGSAFEVLWLLRDQSIELRKSACEYFESIIFYENATMLSMVISTYNISMKQYYSDIINF